MSEAINIPKNERPVIIMMLELLEQWQTMADKGTLRTHHIYGSPDSQTGLKAHFSLNHISDYQKTSLALKLLLEESQIENLETSAENLTIIQCRVDNCKNNINDEDRFWIFQPDVMGSEDFEPGGAASVPLREAVAPYNVFEAFGITEADIERYEKTVIKSLAKLPPLDPLPAFDPLPVMTTGYNKDTFFVPPTGPYLVN